MMLDILEDLNLDRLIINGDLLDLYSVNRYGIHPQVNVDLEQELYIGRRFIENLRKRFPRLEIVYLFGNHEARYEKWVIENAKPMYNLLRLEFELDLAKHDITWFPYNSKYRIEETDCYVQHSPPSYGVNGARTSLLQKSDQSFIFGCSHRQQHATITAGSGKVYECYFNGWLGSTTETESHAQVFSYRKGHHSWQQCFCIVNVIDGKEFLINQYSIRDHKVCVDGTLYDYSDEAIRDDLQYT